MKWLADLLALVSVACLSVPAWYINRYAHLAARATLTRIRLPDPELSQIHLDLLKELRTRRDGWKPWKAWFLHIGTAAGLLAAVLTLVHTLSERSVGLSPQ